MSILIFYVLTLPHGFGMIYCDVLSVFFHQDKVVVMKVKWYAAQVIGTLQVGTEIICFTFLRKRQVLVHDNTKLPCSRLWAIPPSK